MMKKLIFPLILFLLLVSEGVALDLLPNILTSTETLIVPHWIFVFLILIALFYDTSDTFYAVIFGVFFGIFVDIAYTEVLGVYMFVYPLAIYIVQLLKRMLQTNFYMTMIITVISISIVEMLIYFIYSFVGIVDATMSYFVLHRLLPTILANVLFLIPLYFLSVNMLMRWSREQLED